MKWKDVVGYEGRYEVSDEGHVKSLSRPVIYHGTVSMSTERILKASKRNKLAPYVSVSMSIDNVKKNLAIHTIVLNAFVGPCPEGMEGRHMDGDATHNALSNLEWGTPQQNGQDRVGHGTQINGERHHKRILTLMEVEEIRTFFSIPRPHGAKRIIAETYGVAHTTLSSIIHNKSWKK